MRVLIVFILLLNVAWGQPLPPWNPLPTEDLRVPGTMPEGDSAFEQVVEGADPLSTEKTAVTQASAARGPKAKRGTGMVGLQVLSSWIPLKKTLSYTHIFSEKFSLEAEYGWGSFGVPAWIIDIAEIREQRFSLLVRQYTGRSFHFIYGLSHNEMEATVGNRYLENAGAGAKKVFDVKGTGATLGIGNRWHWRSGFTLGMDWFRLHLPLVNRQADTSILDNVEASEREVVRDMISSLRKYPTVVLFGINLGYSF